MRGEAFFRRIMHRSPMAQLAPEVASFFLHYLRNEKVVEFDGRFVLNTHFPPYPSPAFDRLVSSLGGVDDGDPEVPAPDIAHSVTLALTNRCDYRCWHCYNAGRSQRDLPLATWRDIAAQVAEAGAVMVALSGGEPLLRRDLEDIAACFGDDVCVTLNSTGAGLTPQRAEALRAAGVFAAGISLDAASAAEHDRMRGVEGAFDTALAALHTAGEAGLYPYIVAMATRDLVRPEALWPFLDFAAGAGAREVHLLEPAATGRLAGRRDVALGRDERGLLVEYQRQVAAREDLPVLSTYAYVESPAAFGCGAGINHLYIDGSGEVCPCNLVPLSFGNVTCEDLPTILRRMGCRFCQPRTGCVGRLLGRHIPPGPLPVPPEVSEDLCDRHLPQHHALPYFYQVRSRAGGRIGTVQLREAYERVNPFYDRFWLSRALAPVEDLVGRLRPEWLRSVFEAGCGTGAATALLAGRLLQGGRVRAVDLSEGMIAQARRLPACAPPKVEFIVGDALGHLKCAVGIDLVFSSWVLGYIAPKPFFAAAGAALVSGGRLAFLAHKDASPREPLEIFAELVAESPEALRRRLAFPFMRDAAQVENQLGAAGLEPESIWEGEIEFSYGSAEAVLEHLLKSGAGTAFYEAIDPAYRPEMERGFLEGLRARHRGRGPYRVRHEYVAAIAAKP